MSYDVRESLSNKMEEPEYGGYQLIGDSQFLRFSESILNLKRKETNRVFHLGFCVSGQRISDLLRRVQDGFTAVSEKVVLMIGTNDLLRGTSFEVMRDDFDKLLNLLRKDAKKVILLTIPPVLKLKNDEDHWNRLKKYNDHIKQCKDDKKIFVGDAYAEFIVPMVLPKRKLSACSSDSKNYSGNLESIPICSSKWLLTNGPNGERACQRLIPPSSPSKVDNCARPVKKVRHDSRLPRDQNVTITQKTADRRRSSHDSESYDDDRQSPAAIKCSSLSAKSGISGHSRLIKRGILWDSPFVSKSLKDIIRGSQTPLSDGNNLLTTTPKVAPTPKRKRNSYTRAEDNLNGSYDDGSTEDEVNIENAEKIRDECFEMYFASDPRRPDRIHLNTKGLCAIKGIIQNIINFID